MSAIAMTSRMTRLLYLNGGASGALFAHAPQPPRHPPKQRTPATALARAATDRGRPGPGYRLSGSRVSCGQRDGASASRTLALRGKPIYDGQARHLGASKEADLWLWKTS